MGCGVIGRVESHDLYLVLEALRTLQSHQAPHWSHHIETLIYTGVLIVQISPNVSSSYKYSHWTNHIETLLFAEFLIGTLKLIASFFLDQAENFPSSGRFDWIVSDACLVFRNQFRNLC